MTMGMLRGSAPEVVLAKRSLICASIADSVRIDTFQAIVNTVTGAVNAVAESAIGFVAGGVKG